MFAVYEKNNIPEFVQKLLAGAPCEALYVEAVVLVADTWTQTGEKVYKNRSPMFYEKLLAGFKTNPNYKTHTKELTAADINNAGISLPLNGAAYAQKYKMMWVL